MSPRKLNFIYIQVGFSTEQLTFLDTEAERRRVTRVQVVRDAVDHFRSFLSSGSANTPNQSTDQTGPQE